MNRSNFRKLFPDINCFLLNFIERSYQDNEEIDDDQIIDEYFEDKLLDYYKSKVIPQAHTIFELEPFPEELLEDITNIWHENISTKEWFATIIIKLEKKIIESE